MSSLSALTLLVGSGTGGERKERGREEKRGKERERTPLISKTEHQFNTSV